MSDDTHLNAIKEIQEGIKTLYVNDFTQESAKTFFDEFQEASKSGQKIIPIYIDSYGGSVDSLITMSELIKSSDIPVATVAIGKAMSCGSFLLSCGTRGMRYCSPQSRVMIHHVSNVSWGKTPEIKVDTEETLRIEALVFEMMNKNCGKKKGYFQKILKDKGNTDWFLSPQECLKHGIVDYIKVPKLKTKIIVETSME